MIPMPWASAIASPYRVATAIDVRLPRPWPWCAPGGSNPMAVLALGMSPAAANDRFSVCRLIVQRQTQGSVAKSSHGRNQDGPIGFLVLALAAPWVFQGPLGPLQGVFQTDVFARTLAAPARCLGLGCEITDPIAPAGSPWRRACFGCCDCPRLLAPGGWIQAQARGACGSGAGQIRGLR